MNDPLGQTHSPLPQPVAKIIFMWSLFCIVLLVFDTYEQTDGQMYYTCENNATIARDFEKAEWINL